MEIIFHFGFYFLRPFFIRLFLLLILSFQYETLSQYVHGARSSPSALNTTASKPEKVCELRFAKPLCEAKLHTKPRATSAKQKLRSSRREPCSEGAMLREAKLLFEEKLERTSEYIELRSMYSPGAPARTSVEEAKPTKLCERSEHLLIEERCEASPRSFASLRYFARRAGLSEAKGVAKQHNLLRRRSLFAALFKVLAFEEGSGASPNSFGVPRTQFGEAELFPSETLEQVREKACFFEEIKGAKRPHDERSEE